MATRRKEGRIVSAAAVAGLAVAAGLGGVRGAGVAVSVVMALVAWWSGRLTKKSVVRLARRIGRDVARAAQSSRRTVLGRIKAEAAGRAEARAWGEIVGGRAEKDGVALVEVGTAAGRIGIASRPKLTPSQSARLAESADRAGFAVEPDARAGGRATYDWDQVVAVYRARPGTGAGSARDPKYLGASAILRLGLSIARADGVIGAAEVDHVAHFVAGKFGLGPAEARRFEALRVLLGAKPPTSIAGLGRELQARLGVEDRKKVGPILVGIAAADGVVAKKEVAALRAAYRALGLDAATIDALLAKVRTTPAPSSTVAEPAPAPVLTEGSVAIDPVRLGRVLAETEDVARILGEAMRDAEDEAERGAVAPVPAGTPGPRPAAVVHARPDPRIAGLDARYRPAVDELLSRPEWSRDEFEAMARRHALMPASAVEVVNEWSQETLGDLLLEPLGDDSAGLRVQAHLLSNATVTRP